MFRERHIAVALSLVALFAALQGSSCLETREPTPSRHRSNCTTCHGSPTRPGTELLQAAPPYDVAGSTAPDAHAIHLNGNAVHSGVACDACHVVPEETQSVGHIDSALPAEVTFSGRAVEDRAPSYDAELRRCADTYCHLDATPTWALRAEPRERCAACHGAPPPPPHPVSEACHLCHGEVVDEARNIIALDRHIDGVLDVDERCDTCHGTGDLGAPPPDLSGASDGMAIGAHVTHLMGTPRARAMACDECHVVPAAAGDVGHLDGVIDLVFTGVALEGGSMPQLEPFSRSCVDSWCHGSASPAWHDPTPLSCTSCHGNPPAAPHPQMDACHLCHETMNDVGEIALPARHVDGVVDASVPQPCNACHGDGASSAPPADLAGNTDTSFVGVGAHRAHVEGTSTSRAVPCSECHRVPDQTLDSLHIDTRGPAELRFSGVARAFGGSPRFDGNTCSDTYCHGDRFVLGHDSGGEHTVPVWTLTDGSQSTCTSCHGLPPPPPHPAGPLFCSDCHPNIGFPLVILDPDSHVNGIVDL